MGITWNYRDWMRLLLLKTVVLNTSPLPIIFLCWIPMESWVEAGAKTVVGIASALVLKQDSFFTMCESWNTIWHNFISQSAVWYECAWWSLWYTLASYTAVILWAFGCYVNTKCHKFTYIFWIAFLLWKGPAAWLVMLFFPPWEIEKFLAQILQRTTEISSTTNSINDISLASLLYGTCPLLRWILVNCIWHCQPFLCHIMTLCHT
jgi:hypothetical protein